MHKIPLHGVSFVFLVVLLCELMLVEKVSVWERIVEPIGMPGEVRGKCHIYLVIIQPFIRVRKFIYNIFYFYSVIELLKWRQTWYAKRIGHLMTDESVRRYVMEMEAIARRIDIDGLEHLVFVQTAFLIMLCSRQPKVHGRHLRCWLMIREKSRVIITYCA